ncbi:MAG TPA: hypothetical protein VIR54_29625 [Vicinamibacterales bacterium]|jgi:ElaB/YqjD/DUF883 family membrane-anchored ribosome-binding protein
MATALRETTRGVVRDARQAVADARDVAHHAAERLELEARRRPVAAAGVAATAGFLAGCVLAFGLGWFAARRIGD